MLPMLHTREKTSLDVAYRISKYLIRFLEMLMLLLEYTITMYYVKFQAHQLRNNRTDSFDHIVQNVCSWKKIFKISVLLC